MAQKHTTYDDKTVKERKKVTFDENLFNHNAESTENYEKNSKKKVRKK